MKDRVMHAFMTSGDLTLMAADSTADVPVMGDNVSISIDCGNMEEIQRLFKVLSEGGKVIMPLADTFWDAHFGMLVDKYGLRWIRHRKGNDFLQPHGVP